MRPGLVLLGFVAGAAVPAQAAYSLNGASLGTSTVRMTIPKSGTAQSVHTVRLFYSGSGANCRTGELNDSWTSPPSIIPVRMPAGVTVGYTRSPMSLPSDTARGIAINVASTAVPTTGQLSIGVPRGTCQGNNQGAWVTLILEKAP